MCLAFASIAPWHDENMWKCIPDCVRAIYGSGTFKYLNNLISTTIFMVGAFKWAYINHIYYESTYVGLSNGEKKIQIATCCGGHIDLQSWATLVFLEFQHNLSQNLLQ